ncbi:MAG: protein kinase domain-containing protein [Thermoguttaceae bacterium]
MPGAVSDRSIEQSGDKSEDQSVPIPEKIGHYQILGVLGGGGMGTVYRGVNPHLNRPVAIKVVKASRGFRKSSVKRFQRELLAIGKLQHPNIVVAFDAGEYENSPYLVMELPNGTDLARYVQKNGPLPVKEACDIIRQTALGLQHAHDAGMVHRDIKPSNLWLTPDGTVKILDFGLVGFLESEEPIARHHETMDGAILGSPDYISPEQIANSKKVDHRSDIYSLGCTFYYLLTGTPPFGETTELLTTLNAHVKNDLPPLKNYRNDVPASVEAVLRKMTATKRENRHDSAAEVAVAIERNQLPSRPSSHVSAAPIRIVRKAATPAAPGVESLMKRGQLFLEDSDWKQANDYFEKVLDIDPEYAPAYIGKLCAELKVREGELLGNHETPIAQHSLFIKAVRFADEEYKSKIEGYDQKIRTRLEDEERQRLKEQYRCLGEQAKTAATGIDWRKLAEACRAMNGYRNTAELAEQCEERARKIREKKLRFQSRLQAYISAGGLHTVGLKTDGTVVATVMNGLVDCSTQGWRDIIAVSAGGSHTVGLKADGTVVAVGNNNDDGRCDTQGWRDIGPPR